MDYKFSFATVGGTTRVKISSAEDLRHLGELDQKMWTVLACPTQGLEIPEESLSLIDLDGDNSVHVNEVVKTAEWLCAALKDPQTLFEGKDEIALSNIADADILAIAQKLSKDTISLAQVNDAIAAVAITEQPAPDAPLDADVMAAYKEKHDEYAAYYEMEKLQIIGLALIPEETVKPGMSEADFLAMGEKISAYEAACAAVNDANAVALAEAQSVYTPLKKLLLLHRDFCCLLRNYVTFEDFYAHNQAIFQAGTLVIDQRACHLCIRVSDMGKQTAQAPASGIFLVYCNCINRKLGKSMQIVAAVTVGEIRNLTEGKNAIFYDRQGNDYEATITKVLDNPISIRQAFWSPYRKFAKWVTDLINKSASEKNDKAFADMTSKVETANVSPADPAAAAEKKSAFDIAKFAGIFAAIGMALGFIGSFLTDLAKGVSALSWWQILAAIVGILLVISGPAMIMAWIKLRRRNLAPVLNANGWAVNADSIIDVPFGATLTEQAKFPKLQIEKKMSKGAKWCIAILVIAVVAVGLWLGNIFAPVCQSPLPCFNQPVDSIATEVEVVEPEPAVQDSIIAEVEAAAEEGANE